VIATDPSQASYFDMDLRATDGQIMKHAAVHVPLAQFNLAFSDGQIVYSGQDTTLPLHVLGIPPFNLSCSGLPSGMSCSSDASGWDDQTFNVNLIFHTAGTVLSGDYSFTLLGTSSAQSYSHVQKIHVAPSPNFSLSAISPPTWALVGENATIALRFVSNESFRNSVSLSCSSPAFQDCASVQPFLEANQTQTVNLLVQAKPGISTGQYPLTITANSGNITHSVALQIDVVSFAGSTLSASTISMTPSSSATVNFTAAVAGNFSGDVTVLCNPDSAVITCTPSPTHGIVAAGTSLQSVLSLHAGQSASIRNQYLHSLWFAMAIPLMSTMLLNNRRRTAPRLLAMLLLFFLVSCGGGNSPGTGNNGGGGPFTTTHSVKLQLQTTRAGSPVTIDAGAFTIKVQH
jgi:hypothetical protein